METVIERRQVADVSWASAELPPLLQRIYSARGIQSADELEHGLKQLLPFDTLLGIDQAVACLVSALQLQEHILVLGDFDADGATSTALAIAALRSFGAGQLSYLVPNRFEFGYGLTPEIVTVAAEKKPDIIITVDNGISSNEGVAAANERGIRVIVTDHHLPGAKLPDAVAIVNPNQKGDVFPSKNLAGVGVIFYVMLALRSHLRSIDWFAQQNIEIPNMTQFLDLVALGTVSDVVPLDKNNRILVHQGLLRIRAGRSRIGFRALLAVAKRDPSILSASDLGFAVGPRLNAAGRLDDMALGIEGLLCEDPNRAREIAMQLDSLNKERRTIEADMQQQAVGHLKNLELDDNMPTGLCLFNKTWHQGVIGILASRIKERLHRPVVAFAVSNDGVLKGSARSVPSVHIRDVFDAIATRHTGLITKFGGHAMAAGLSLSRENYDAFSKAFDEEVSRHLKPEDLHGTVQTDGELSAEEHSIETADLLCRAGPWGQGFPEPVFDGIFAVVQQRIVGQRHLKLTLAVPGTTRMINAIAFNVDLEAWPNNRCKKVELAYRLDINEYRGLRSVQLVVSHLKMA